MSRHIDKSLISVKALLSHRAGDLVSLTLNERGESLVAWCPNDEIVTLTRELILDRVYETADASFHENMLTVVDAGAYVGIFSLQASQWSERVVSLEADPINFGLLTLNIQRNALNNVDARHCALWSASTKALKFSSGDHTAGGRVVEESQGDNGSVSAVRAVSLDDLISELGHIDLLKIDIEGAEYEAIGACKNLDEISQIVGEIHLEDEGDRAKRDALIEQLQDSGFSVSLFTEADLLSRSRVRRLWRNRTNLKGRRLIKCLVAAYYLAPIEKPIRPPGATYELPILVAHR